MTQNDSASLQAVQNQLCPHQQALAHTEIFSPFAHEAARCRRLTFDAPDLTLDLSKRRFDEPA